MWDLSCPDWQDRIRKGQSLVPDLPLFEEEAEMGMAFFERIRLTDVLGEPLLRDACGDWFKDVVLVLFGSRDPKTNVRYVREIFILVPKGNSKTTYSAALMIVALLMNVRKNVEFLFLAPTQAISDIAMDASKAMVEADDELSKRFHVRDHKKEIYDRVNRCKLKVKTFDVNVMTGPKPAGVLIDELHLLGRSTHTQKVLRQIRGGMRKNTDGFVIFITTQSDDIPTGAFKSELQMARKIRDGKAQGRMLPILYEFPEDIAKDESKWSDPKNWHMVTPNLGRSLHLQSLVEDFKTEAEKGAETKRLWASQHLNIEIGLGLKTDGWVGAPHWEKRSVKTLTVEEVVRRSEVVVVSVDGGGLDDLFGMCVLGRDKNTKEWLAAFKGWCHRGILSLRQTIAPQLLEFEKDGSLRIVDDELEDLSEIIEVISGVKQSGKLVCVAVDPAGLGEFVEELKEIGITAEEGTLVGVPQGYALMNAIKTAERKLANGTLLHDGSACASFCVGNLKIEPTATAIRATKMNAGDAKIDLAMALFDAVFVMVKNPPPPQGRSYLDTEPVLVL